MRGIQAQKKSHGSFEGVLGLRWGRSAEARFYACNLLFSLEMKIKLRILFNRVS